MIEMENRQPVTELAVLPGPKRAPRRLVVALPPAQADHGRFKVWKESLADSQIFPEER